MIVLSKNGITQDRHRLIAKSLVDLTSSLLNK